MDKFIKKYEKGKLLSKLILIFIISAIFLFIIGFIFLIIPNIGFYLFIAPVSIAVVLFSASGFIYGVIIEKGYFDAAVIYVVFIMRDENNVKKYLKSYPFIRNFHKNYSWKIKINNWREQLQDKFNGNVEEWLNFLGQHH